MQFNRKKFFDGYQSHLGSLTAEKRAGLEFLLSKFEEDNWTDIRLIAYCLATVKHESADTFKPIKEYRSRVGSKGRANQDRYWLSGYYGRGYVQITWKKNYEKLGKKTGADLVNNPNLALNPEIAYEILVIGMLQGLFTGKKLSDYINDKTTDYKNARRIVNGTDKADLIARYASSFEKILALSKVSTDIPKPAEHSPSPIEKPAESTNNSVDAPAEIPAQNIEQTADNIINQSADTDAAKVEAARTQPPVEIPKTKPSGFGTKVMAFFTAIFTGEYLVPQFVQDGAVNNQGVIINFIGSLLRAAYENRYLIIGVLVVWYVTKKLNNAWLTSKIADINTDQTRGNIVLVEPERKKGLFEKGKEFFFGEAK